MAKYVDAPGVFLINGMRLRVRADNNSICYHDVDKQQRPYIKTADGSAFSCQPGAVAVSRGKDSFSTGFVYVEWEDGPQRNGQANGSYYWEMFEIVQLPNSSVYTSQPHCVYEVYCNEAWNVYSAEEFRVSVMPRRIILPMKCVGRLPSPMPYYGPRYYEAASDPVRMARFVAAVDFREWDGSSEHGNFFDRNHVKAEEEEVTL